MPPRGIQTEIDIDNLFRTSQLTINYPGTSQYATGAVSSCGMAAANFARTVIKLARSAEDTDDVLKQITSLDKIQDIMSICRLWVTAGCDAHLEVEEIVAMTSFRKAMETVEVEQGLVNGGGFLETLRKLEVYAPGKKPAVAIITRIPEIVACAKLSNKRGSVYAIFDSHPRQHDHPDGAGLLLFTKLEAAASYLSDLFHVDLALDDGEWQSTEYFDIFQSQIFVDPNPPVVQLAADLEMYSVLLSQRRELERLRKEGRKAVSSSIPSITEVQAPRKTTAQESLLSNNDSLKAQLADLCSCRDQADRRLFATRNDATSVSEQETPLLPILSSDGIGALSSRQCPHGAETSDADKDCPLTDVPSTKASRHEMQEDELMSLRLRVEELERERLAVTNRAARHRGVSSNTVPGKRSDSHVELVSKQTNLSSSHSDHTTLRELKAQVLDLKHQLLGQTEAQDSVRTRQAALPQEDHQGHVQKAVTLAPDDDLDLSLAEALQREFLRDLRDGREDDDRVHQQQSQCKPTNVARRQPDLLLAEELRKAYESQKSRCNVNGRQGLRLEAHNTARQFISSHAENPQKETSEERLADIEKPDLQRGAHSRGEATGDVDPVVARTSLEAQESSQSSTDQNQHVSRSASSFDSEHMHFDGEHLPLCDHDATIQQSIGTTYDRFPSQKQDFFWTIPGSDEEIAAQDGIMALHIQGHYDLEHDKLASEREDLTLKFLDHEEQPFLLPAHERYTQYDMIDADRETAERMQREYDDEDRRLAAITAQLSQETATQPTFTCVICMEVHSVEYMALVPHCDHRTCRDCMRAQIETTLGEGRYPVFCPCCDNEGDKSKIEEELIEAIGISQECYQQLERLSVAVFAVDTTCPKCKQAFRLDREETTEADILDCPLPGCGFSWCKRCNQEVVAGQEHSCDGEKEFQRLKDAGILQYCPGCKTPCEKIDGCNHMQCKAPGCDTHFCYTCGKSLHKGAANNRRINDKIYAHWTRNECRTGALFDAGELAEHVAPPPARRVTVVPPPARRILAAPPLARRIFPLRRAHNQYSSDSEDDSDDSEDSLSSDSSSNLEYA